MPKIFIIGESLSQRDFGLLDRYGEISKIKSIQAVHLRADEQAALFVIDKDQRREPSFKDFTKTFLDVPKIIMSPDSSSKGLTPWLSLPFTYPVHNPTPKELSFLVDRLIQERDLHVENKKLKGRLLGTRRELQFFDEIGRVLNSDMELDNMLVEIMKKTRDMINASSWSIFLLDEETGEFVLEKKDEGKKKGSNLKKTRLRPGEGIAGWVVKEGIPLIVPDVSHDERFMSGTDKRSERKAQSLICVPVKSKERVIGVMEFAKKAETPFTKDDLDLLVKLMDYAALSIERVSLYHKMAELAITDDLTKLFNSRYLNRTIEVEIHRCERSRTSVSLIFMDIDYFKQVNDHHGHLVGSKLLVEVSQLLMRSLRSIDIVARYGGDEFVVVLPQTPPDVAAKVAERIRKSIAQNTFLKKDGYIIKITASFGVSSYPESAKSKEELLKLADEAMYRVKNYTRNGVYAII